MIFSRLFSRSEPESAARTLYAGIVAQARQPALYVQGGVADTLEGRFEMVVLHAALVMRRLRGEAQDGQDLAQGVFDTMFVDMDHSLREIGVGDLSVGKKVRSMAEAFYGRARVYDEALNAEGDDRARLLAGALARNVFRTETPDAQARALACYVLATDRRLADMPADALLAGRAEFPALPDALETTDGTED